MILNKQLLKDQSLNKKKYIKKEETWKTIDCLLLQVSCLSWGGKALTSLRWPSIRYRMATHLGCPLLLSPLPGFMDISRLACTRWHSYMALWNLVWGEKQWATDRSCCLQISEKSLSHKGCSPGRSWTPTTGRRYPPLPIQKSPLSPWWPPVSHSPLGDSAATL